MPIPAWDIYEIRSDAQELHGVKLRGRVRKFALENGITCLVENASDVPKAVRFAILSSDVLESLSQHIHTILPRAEIIRVLASVQNPVLSKLKVNDGTRYA